MTDNPPQIIGSPVYDPRQKWVPGSSLDFSCFRCQRTLVVAPSSLRHMRAVPGEYLRADPVPVPPGFLTGN